MDTDLVVRAQNGDQGAFAGLTQAFDERFHGVAFGILRDMSLAQDAVQSALLAVWRDLPRLRDPIAFEAWACRILVRACYAESRRWRGVGSPGGTVRIAATGDTVFIWSEWGERTPTRSCWSWSSRPTRGTDAITHGGACLKGRQGGVNLQAP